MGRLNRTNGLYIVTGSLLVITAILASSNLALADPLTPIQGIEQRLGIPDETDVKAPVDYGPGPGVKPNVEIGGTRSLSVDSRSTSQIPVGGAGANIAGAFGPAVTWPLIPIHMVLLPNGQVMSYGTDASGQQGAQLIYDVWNPQLGIDASSHLVLPNKTNTDVFCGAQSVMLSGDVLTSGGDLTVNGVRNSANNDTTIFSPSTNTLTANTPMTYARWYGSLVALPNGQLAIFGGRQNVGVLTPTQAAETPELYDPFLRTWTSLTGATSNAAFSNSWFFPRSYVAPGGRVFVLGHDGSMFFVSTAGVGRITQSTMTVPPGDLALPTIPFAPGMALSVRSNQQVVVIDYRTSTPVVTQTNNIDQDRFWASGTILADGRVLVTGGSQIANQLAGVAFQAEIWDPKTGVWTAGATATKPRLYHSNSMLLPDATVLTGGGGAPGPVINLNSEIYYPPYLYAANGTPAVRPVISATASKVLNPGDTIIITVGPTDIISRLTFVRTGSGSHSNNSDQRFIDLAFTQVGPIVIAVLSTDTTTLVPGFYMLFAFNNAGVPSEARIFEVTR
jgi:galactose oxidase-like protein